MLTAKIPQNHEEAIHIARIVLAGDTDKWQITEEHKSAAYDLIAELTPGKCFFAMKS